MLVPTTLLQMAKGATPAISALMAANVPYDVLRYDHDPRSESYGNEAVDALAGSDLDPDQVFKTLVVALPNGLAVAVLPVGEKLSLKLAAAALGAPKATMADPDDAQRSSGYVLGGISPLGQRRKLPTVIDESALLWDRVLCSAGKRGLEIAVAPEDLVRLTDAVTSDICAR